jgi:uncharacterized protein YkwD
LKRIRIFLSLLAAVALLAGLCAPPAAAAADTAGFPAEVLRLVNAERKRAGLAALAEGSASLNAAAQKRAQEIAVKFDHKRPDGSTCFTVLADYGVPHVAGGENIAAGYATPAGAMDGWMNSPGHKANILGDYESLGVGVYVKDGRVYWSQMFIREGGAAKAPRWAAWPAWLQWLLRVVFFGWAWMR